MRYSRHLRTMTLCAVALLLLGGLSRAQAPGLTGAEWELRALGVTTPERLEALRADANKRPVTLAIVGQGGVSKSLLEAKLIEGNTLEYRQWPEGQDPDPRASTHDTQAAHVILDLTLKLGLKVRVLVYQPGESTQSVAQAFAAAGAEADIVALYQSFWGDVLPMAEAIGQAERALFISPYVEVGEPATNTCLQSYAAKPWADGYDHFVTVIPLARSQPDALISPLNRPELDTEVVNFIAPSFYASSAGGTCPSAEVAAAVAAWIIPASPEKPSPEAIVELMRQGSVVDRESLTSLPEFTEEAVTAVERHISALSNPPAGERRRLDAAGVLNLWAVREAMGR
ncbi:MAG TPA: hypothetical protein PLD23_19850 [Armatimonadota bacterium]|nr:hypothetical protein [Armatimonadota bacterium]